MFIRHESFQSFTRLYPVVTVLIGIHIVLFLWMNLLPGLGGLYIQWMGVGWNARIFEGEYWRLLTPIFLHVSLTHMLFNSFSLFLFGPALEQMLGRGRFIAAYFATGILANVATLFIVGNTTYLHLGASGAIFGLFGMYMYMVLYRKDLIDQGNQQVVMTILMIGLIMTFVNPNINIWAHIFGLIAGAAISPVILHNVKSFNMFSAPRRRPLDDGEIGFDPQRWQKKARSKKRIQIVLFTVIGVLVLIGLAARFL
ncbi:rhomboid family intramembrane serine protease [Alteribacter lacisalsi]|jgi:rhomboid protease GluP|uniref:Rhomboid family intramembrane serine protease n=1 Tax=Alteribacter lacisalsi TaxID=2045244 RepID=A0A2W0H5M2_9BACI|nr:rhomboid family intramembrane serine protease [Alteribacter lacisalsi]PYZ95480.1 rhomboid family intramembrane serine protease [Alteribacter lacisalsi]